MSTTQAEIDAVGQSTLDVILPLLAGMSLAAAGGVGAPAGRVVEMFGAVTAGTIAAVLTALNEARLEDERSADELRASVMGVVDYYLKQMFPDWHGSN